MVEEKKPGPSGKYQVFLIKAPDREAVAQLIAQRLGKGIDDARRLASGPGVIATDMNPLQAEDLVVTIKGTGGNAEKKLIFSSVNCPVHTDQPGRALCQVCGKIICSVCLKSAKAKPICPECTGELNKIKIPFPWLRLVLLLVLIGVGVYAYLTLTRERAKFVWNRPFKLAVVGFMVELPPEWRSFTTQFTQANGSGYVDLKAHTLPDVVGWFEREYKRYGGVGKPIELEIFGPFDETDPPPAPPAQQGKFLDRYFQYQDFKKYFSDFNRRHEVDAKLKDFDGVIYVQFVKGKYEGFLESYASRRARMGIVNCFLDQDMAEVDIMIVLHEFAHLLNAKDHYGSDLNPINPEGYVQPFEEPLYPQKFADLMAGRVPRDKNNIQDIRSLSQLRIGIYTANEIGWITDEQLQKYIQDRKTPPME